jgi:protein-S-isoprenylcysteine O-methyltransferase Ste14
MTVEELPLRRALVCASGLIYWGGVAVQARRIRKHIGRSPNLRPRGPKEKALWLGWLLVSLAWIVQPWFVGGRGTNPLLTPLPWLVSPLGFAAGVALLVLGYAGTLWTYSVMGDAWRIGIDRAERTVLVRRGPYRWVRHPIYALQVVMLAGAGLLLPTLVSLGILAIHYLCVRIKAGDEEDYLTEVHGASYQDYVSRTGRLFPGWMRKRVPGIDS